VVDSKQLATMPISEVVRQSGGNGLASPAFETPLNFLGVFGWQHVENGVEALLCDGELVPNTRIRTDILRLFGRRRFIRRVLLKPAPLEVVAEALTADQRKLALDIAVKLEVRDPVYVASLENPLAELTNVMVGIVSEYIRTHNLHDLMMDSGQTREALLDRLINTTSITRHYQVIEVLKALPAGDESLIEVGRQREIARAEADLIDARGQNELIEARYRAAILRGEAEIQEEIANREHQRRLELAAQEGKLSLAKTAIETLGQVATSGIDPMPLAQDIINRLGDSTHRVEAGTDRSSAAQGELPRPQSSQVQIEGEMLESIRESVQMLAYDVATSGDQIRGAVIQMPGYEIVFACDKEYPSSKPEISVRFPDGRMMQPNQGWIPGVTTSMAQAVLVIAAQIAAYEG
jgi:hypothetical protein